MTATAEQNPQSQIEQLLNKINAAWLNGRLEELESYFHDEMVIVFPGFQGRGEGKDACAESYRQFISQATIRDYKESDHAIDVWGDTAVASYRFEMDYEIDGESNHDAGQDLFVFARQNGQWLAVWRTIII